MVSLRSLIVAFNRKAFLELRDDKCSIVGLKHVKCFFIKPWILLCAASHTAMFWEMSHWWEAVSSEVCVVGSCLSGSLSDILHNFHLLWHVSYTNIALRSLLLYWFLKMKHEATKHSLPHYITSIGKPTPGAPLFLFSSEACSLRRHVLHKDTSIDCWTCSWTWLFTFYLVQWAAQEPVKMNLLLKYY